MHGMEQKRMCSVTLEKYAGEREGYQATHMRKMDGGTLFSTVRLVAGCWAVAVEGGGEAMGLAWGLLMDVVARRVAAPTPPPPPPKAGALRSGTA